MQLHTHVPIIRASSESAHLATLLLGGAVSDVRLTSWDRLPSLPLVWQGLHLLTTSCPWRPITCQWCRLHLPRSLRVSLNNTCFRSRAAMQWPGFWSVSVSFVV